MKLVLLVNAKLLVHYKIVALNSVIYIILADEVEIMMMWHGDPLQQH